MKQNYIWLSTYCKQFLATFLIAFTVSAGFAQTYVNGNLGTGATSNNGTAAAPGTTWHELQHNNPTESNISLAFGHQSFLANDLATADDFTVPGGFTWTLSTLRVYSVDQVIPVTGTTSPYTNIRVRIWNGIPGAPGSTVVFGDMTTNRFASTAFSGRKLIGNTLVPTSGAPAPNLPLFSIDATVNAVLTAGTYWVEWQVVHTANCFGPTSQTVGIRTMPGYNARQRNGAVWSALIDGGNPASAPDVAVDLPFTITYTAPPPVGCTGTPAPGNTITSASAVCQNTPFTLSLQNNTPGAGVTYQWQSASAVGGPYANIAGATNPTLSVASISSTTFYRAIVTCAGNNGTSTPVQVTANSPAQCGCTSSATSNADEDIFNVSIGTLNNSSTCASTGTGPGSVQNLYSNYTSGLGAPPTAFLAPGTSYPLSVQIGTCGGNYGNGVAVFIDYNQNGLLTDPGEKVYFSPASTSGPHIETANITIPVGATLGATLMRVVNVEIFNPSTILPCGTYTWGETEDYLVNIGVQPPCSGTPNPGATNSSSTSVCSTVSFTLSPANFTPGLGVTYQWQSASVAGGPYTNIPGANSSNYSTTVSNMYYQVVVTCSGNSGTSTPVFVATAPFTQCYCASTATSTADEEIFNVTVGTLNSSSTCATTAPGPGSVRNLYSNYTSGTGAPAAPNLVQGLNSPFSVQIGTCGGNYGNSVAIFIDLNQNGVFTDAGERVYVSPATTQGPHVETGNLIIPANATLGVTRMRVISVETAPNFILPCGTYTWGETEDYNVNIIPCVPAAITTSPANTSAVCAGSTTFSVSTSGTIAAYQWQYRVNATSPWITVPNAPPYSGPNTATLTISPLDPTMNGYQYRVIVTGACTGADFSAPATLTITPIVTIITPASAAICLGAIQPISIVNTLGNATLISAGFDAGIPAGWATQNRSVPIGTVPTWAQGSVAAAGYPAFSGAPTSFVYSNYQVAAQTGAPNIISNWLFTPSVSIKNGDVLTFRTRQPVGPDYPDRLEVRASANAASTNVGATATSVGDFTTLLLTINPTLATGVYPKAWTLYTVTVSGLAAPITGRLAFRVFTPDDGTGTNQDMVGLDDVTYVSTGAGALGVFTTNAPGTIFTDPLATTPYVAGTLINTVYVKPIATATYTVSYTTASGCISAPTTVTVTVSSAVGGTPTFSNTSICVGNNGFIKLGGTLTGGPNFVHNFQVKVPGATTFSNITAGGVYSFSGDTLKFTNVPLSLNGYQYRDSISTPGNCGSLISTVATLSVNPIPVVTISAAPRRNLFPGLTTTLTAAVSGVTPPVTYQWFRNGVAVPLATNNTLVVGIDGVGTYTVRATAQGCSSADSTTTPKTITIGDSVGVTTLFIYPSPNTGKFQVRYFSDINNGSKSPAMVNVFDQKGAKVFSKSYGLGAGYQQMNVDLGTHGKGIYRVELTDLNGDRIKTGSVMVF